MKRISLLLMALLLSLTLCLSGCKVVDDHNPSLPNQNEENLPIQRETEADSGSETEQATETAGNADSVLDIPAYSGVPYVHLNGGVPNFTDSDLTTQSYERYSPLDSLGRCGVTVACIGVDLMPTEERGDIGSVKPSGWVNNRYDSDLVSGGYIYNRSHLIGFQLTGENANERNLITGTRYFNVEGMLPFENMVADYLKEEPDNHVLYRVTPIYDGNNLVANGVEMEAYSVEDDGDGICFHVFVYNVQPGIVIDYATGNNWLDTENPPAVSEAETKEILTDTDGKTVTYILNTGSKKFHIPSCSLVSKISEKNRKNHTGTRAELLEEGYTACQKCVS